MGLARQQVDDRSLGRERRGDPLPLVSTNIYLNHPCGRPREEIDL